jgi:MFS family permease
MLMIGATAETVLWLVPFWTRSLIPFGIISAILTGLAAAVFSISFNVLASSASDEIRGRVMSFAYLPVNLGFSFGPMIGSQLVKLNLFYIYPFAFLVTALGVLVLRVARRQPAPSGAEAT